MQLARFLCRERIGTIHPFPVEVRGQNNSELTLTHAQIGTKCDRAKLRRVQQQKQARLTGYEGERRPPSTWIDEWPTNPFVLACVALGSVQIAVVTVALRRHNSGREYEWCSEAVHSALNAETDMHPRPLPQKYPPTIRLPAGISRRLIAHEVVHVSAALLHVVVADLPTIGRRTSYPISH
eukprot:999711-Pleurochrysis_carterae.AAC.1